MSPIISGSGGGGGGALTPLYSNVLGVAAASIDTGAAGIATSANVLLVYMYLRTDETVLSSTVNLTLNNDGGANYDQQNVNGNNASVAAASTVAQTSFTVFCNGASRLANGFSLIALELPAYAGTTGLKSGYVKMSLPDSTAANQSVWVESLEYRSTTAVSRLKIAPATAGKNFVAGSAVYIYGI